MNLFVGSMLTLVLADNMLLPYLGWEGVGLCSYLLIGFWYMEPENGYAARKAFVVTRVGDMALAVGLFLLFTQLGTLQIQEVMLRARETWPPGSILSIVAALLLLGGAVGKSAQLPLQTWLPDAMAGPTPVRGFVLLGVFARNRLALQGVVTQILCNGISTGALFILVGALLARIHTRDLQRMGGLWSIMPRMGVATMLFSLASLGLPGLGNFIGEFLVLVGAFRVSVPLVVAASLGLITSCVYSLWIVQRTFHGPNEEGWKPPDLSIRETAVMATMTVLIVWLGLFPQPVFTPVNPSLERLEGIAAHSEYAMQTTGGSQWR